MKIPEFGQRLAQAREAAGLTLTEAATKSDLLYNNIQRIENSGKGPRHWRRKGPPSEPKWRTIYRLVVGCGLDLAFFFPAELILRSAARLQEAAKRGA